jgi:hypothetical protein
MPLEGTWINQIGSKMELKLDGLTLHGTYKPAVDGGDPGEFSLAGRFDPSVETTPGAKGQPLGFVVAWNNHRSGNSHIVTTWSGQYQVLDDEEVITTFWLITKATSEGGDWLSTYLGQDIFSRHDPSPDTIALKRRLGPSSHPTNLLGRGDMPK